MALAAQHPVGSRIGDWRPTPRLIAFAPPCRAFMLMLADVHDLNQLVGINRVVTFQDGFRVSQMLRIVERKLDLSREMIRS
jgi:hypothetical protein